MPPSASRRRCRLRCAFPRARAAAVLALLSSASTAHAANLYWDSNGAASGGSGSQQASGTWGSSAFWSGAAAGNAATGAWGSGSTAVFSAGTNVTGTSTVSVSGTQSAAGVVFEEGFISLTGSGTVSFTGGGQGGATITVGSGTQSRAAVVHARLTAASPLAVARGTSNLATISLHGDDNAFAGGLVIDGQMRVNANDDVALGGAGSTVTVTGSETAISGATTANSTPVTITLANPFVLNPSGSPGFVAGFAAGGGVAVRNRLILAGGISGPADVILTTVPRAADAGATLDANGLTVFAGINTYSGRTIVNVAADGAFQLGSAAALPAGTALVLGRGQAADNDVGPVDLAGRDITIASLATDTGQSGARGITNSSAGAGGNITVTGSAQTTFAGVLGALGSAALVTHGYHGTGRLSLTLSAAHTGSLTLTAVNTYSGATTILGGTLHTTGVGTLGAPGGTVVNHAALQLHSANALGGVSGTGSTTVGDGVAPTVVSATHVRQPSLTVANGSTVAIDPSGGAAGGVSSIAALTIAPLARFDLKDNKLVTADPIGTENAGVYDGVQGEVQRASNGGAWDQPGLTTSMADALAGLTSVGVASGEQLRGLGAGDTELFMGQTISGASTIAMYTYAGDANLDGLISGDDYAAIDFSFAVPGSDGWYNGDFNYDGIISGDDYAAIDFNIVAQGAPFPAGAMSGFSAVPEPACGTITFAAAAAAARITRRRRRGTARRPPCRPPG